MTGIGALLLAAATLPAVSGGVSCPDPLFTVARSTNRNVVVYEANLRPDGSLDPRRPVVPNWLLADGRQEALTPFERAWAYGVDATPEGDGYRLLVRALRSRPLHVAIAGDCPVITARIDGEPAILRRVFVDVSGSGLVPSVRFVDLEGTHPDSGDPAFERLFSDGLRGQFLNSER